MPLNLIFIQPGDYTIEDDGVPGNNTSVIKDGNGVVIFTFAHPADELGFTAETPGVNITVNLTDSLGAANFTIGSLTDPAHCPDGIVIQSVRTTGSVTLVSNGAIIEGGDDAAPDIFAGSLIMSAGTGVGTGSAAIETQTGFIEAETGTGGINIGNFGDLHIGSLTDEVNGLSVATSGDIRLTNLGYIRLSESDLDTLNPPAPLETIKGGSTSGDVFITANGYDSDIIATTNLDAINASGGSIFLTAGRDVAFGTAGPDFDNDVRARGSVTVNAGRDFLIDGFADLSSDGFGQNTGGNVVINAGRNISVLAVTGIDGSIAAEGSGGGDVTLTTGVGGAVTLNAPSPFALRSISGDVTVNADRVLINAASGITSNGLVTLRPVTAGREILLGSALDSSYAMELSDAELDRITATTLVIGATNSGPLRVIDDITPVNAPDLILRSGTDITVSALIHAGLALSLRAGDDLILSSLSSIMTGTFTGFVDINGDDLGRGGSATLGGGFAAGAIVINGQAEFDRLTGGSGNDFLKGEGGNDLLSGQGGNDTLDGGTGIDTASGGLGDDVYVVDHAGDVVVEAFGEGNDTISTSVGYVLKDGVQVETLRALDPASLDALNLTGNAFDNMIEGNAGINVLRGNGGADTLFGFGSNDRLFGGHGTDSINGGDGADIINVLDGEQGDHVDGGTGIDLYNFGALLAYSVTINLNAGSSQVMDGGLAFGTATTVFNIENVTGGGLGDTIIGSALANVLLGGGGDDLLDGRQEADQLNGGAGNDRLIGHVGADELIGGAGVDSAEYAASNAGVTINLLAATTAGGHAAGDTLLQVEDLVGSAFMDILTGSSDANLLQGAGGNDRLTGGLGDDHLQGGEGDDILFGDAGADRLNGGNGVDLANYGASSAGVTINLEGAGATGGDAEGDIVLNVENIVGSAHADSITGNAAVNALSGGDGADVLNGRSGDDALNGGAGDDILIGSLGNDSMTGGTGLDSFTFASGFAGDVVNLFQDDADTLRLNDDLWGGGLTAAQVLATFATQNGPDSVVLDFGGGNILTVNATGLTVQELENDILII